MAYKQLTERKIPDFQLKKAGFSQRFIVSSLIILIKSCIYS